MLMKNQMILPGDFRGFTLVELMVAMVVAVVLLGVGMPSFVEFIRNNQTVSETNKLTRDLNYARSEAINRGRSITICRSNTGAGCTNTNWEAGWIVFLDLNGNGVVNGANDTILQVNDGLDANFTLRAANNSLTYAPDGTINGINIDVFRVCRPGTVDMALQRGVEVRGTGRATILPLSSVGGAVCP